MDLSELTKAERDLRQQWLDRVEAGKDLPDPIFISHKEKEKTEYEVIAAANIDRITDMGGYAMVRFSEDPRDAHAAHGDEYLDLLRGCEYYDLVSIADRREKALAALANLRRRGWIEE